MKVIGHETKTVHLPSRFLATLLECRKEALAILVIIEDAFSMVTTTHEVVNGAGILDAQLSRHCAEEYTGGWFNVNQ